MKRFALGLASLLVLFGCQSDRVVSPPDKESGMPPDLAIQGGRNGGNPNFFFLPPLSNFVERGRFNTDLSPTVKVCELQAGDCKAGGYYQEFPDVRVVLRHYRQNWKIPKNVSTQYRISVEVFGVQLGFVDVNTSRDRMSGFLNVNDGITLPVIFWITSDCPVAGSCVDPNTGGTVLTTTPDGGIAGVTIPPQPDGGDPITLTFGACNPDLSANGFRVFGSCIHIDSDLEGTLSNEAIVFICDVLTDPVLPSGEEHDHIHLHRRHDGAINVLPNTASPLCPTVGGNASIGGVIRALAHGQWKRAGSRFLGLVGPEPLYATVLHLGAGGSTGAFSDFQFALEAPGLPIGYGSDGWSYQIGGSVASGWQTGPLFPSFGTGGFGEDHSGCSLIQSGTHTSWPSGNTSLYLRRNFSLEEAATVRIGVAVDNDVEIYVDGVDVGPGLLVHDNCPTLDSFVRTVPLSAGVHQVAIRAVDRGGSSYFDASITIAGE